MRVATIENGIVTNLCEADAEWVAANGGIEIDGIPLGIGWHYDGVNFTPPPAQQLTQTDFTSAVQAHLDATARTRNYDGILSACSYATSTNLPFSLEGAACVVWRDAVWLYCYAELAKVQAGTRSIPASTAGFIAELPVISW